jgi:hypothetical protein
MSDKETRTQNQETEQHISLAELSRQYLFGEVGVDEYFALERQLTPQFGETAVTTFALEEQTGSPKREK